MALCGACSAPPPDVIIVRESADTGGQTGIATGGAGPSFQPGTGGAGGTSAPPPASGGVANGGVANGGVASSGGSGSSGPAASGVPCDLATYFAAACTSCHGNPPLPSALAGLVTYDDMMKTSVEDPTKNEAQLSLVRMKDAARPMPPGALPPAADVALLEQWINAGYPRGSCGTGAGPDGGGPPPPPPPPPPSVFDGAPAYQLHAGGRAHNAGRDCMQCHQGSDGEAPIFSFGGTLYDPSGAPVSGAEVRLVDASGKATSVYTATNGTFYAGGRGFAGPARVGVRNANQALDMFTPLQATNGGACSSCHCTGASCSVAPVHLP
jgi:hypothetical protein